MQKNRNPFILKFYKKIRFLDKYGKNEREKIKTAPFYVNKRLHQQKKKRSKFFLVFFCAFFGVFLLFRKRGKREKSHAGYPLKKAYGTAFLLSFAYFGNLRAGVKIRASVGFGQGPFPIREAGYNRNDTGKELREKLLVHGSKSLYLPFFYSCVFSISTSSIWSQSALVQMNTVMPFSLAVGALLAGWVESCASVCGL